MLRDDLIFLRALEAEDLDFLYALENDSSLWHVSDTVTPISRYTLQKYLDNAGADFEEVRQLRLVICAVADQRALGTVDLFDFEPRHQRAGVGIAVLPHERKRGYARSALKLLATYARQTLHLHQLYCTINADNSASQKLFEQVGFQFVGARKDWLRTAKGWQDVVEYQCLLDI
ncbi:GNAT family N-acetyltransferase [Hymenobacter sp.]|jgi:diamine N-acetyltransferase|uniref:GNAT family N-acetyltransferase n=1 Tax=Hymenobacter sp. TaxID=1898978 RepID=UPI002EDBA77B